MKRTTSSDSGLDSESFAVGTKANQLLSVAIAEGAALRERLLEQAGGAYSADQLAAVIGCTSQAVHRGRMQNRYFGVPTGHKTYAYPKFQVTPTGPQRGLQEYLNAFGTQDAWMQLLVLLSPSERLEGRTPLDALRRGESQSVLAIAAAYGGHGG